MTAHCSSGTLQGVSAGQKGSVILEAIIALAIFSFGILGLIGVQANMIGQSIDAKYRADAAYLANQIISQMWVDRSNLAAYAHYASGANACVPSGSASANANALAWVGEVASVLPGAVSDKQKIKVTAGTNATLVEVTVCWQRPQDSVTRNHVTVAQINN